MGRVSSMRHGAQLSGTSSTESAKHILGKAIETVDAAAASEVRNERNWRWGYSRHVVKSVCLAASDPKRAAAVSLAGLEAAASSMIFFDSTTSSTMPLSEALRKCPASSVQLDSVCISGNSQPCLSV